MAIYNQAQPNPSDRARPNGEVAHPAAFRLCMPSFERSGYLIVNPASPQALIAHFHSPLPAAICWEVRKRCS